MVAAKTLWLALRTPSHRYIAQSAPFLHKERCHERCTPAYFSSWSALILKNSETERTPVTSLLTHGDKPPAQDADLLIGGAFAIKGMIDAPGEVEFVDVRLVTSPWSVRAKSSTESAMSMGH